MLLDELCMHVFNDMNDSPLLIICVFLGGKPPNPQGPLRLGLGIGLALYFWFRPIDITVSSFYVDSEMPFLNPNLGDADPGGLGACPQKNVFKSIL
jgi:hypothetical protein